MEFHISKQARDKYNFDRSLYQSSGNVIFPNFHGVRVFVQRMNDKRDLVRFPEQAVRAGEINAMGLIDEILHYIVFLYREQVDGDAFKEAREYVKAQLGEDELEYTLLQFVRDYPPASVYRGEQSPEEYLDSTSGDASNRDLALEELLMLYISNRNRAFKKYDELFDDSGLKTATVYENTIEELDRFFSKKPGFGPGGDSLVNLLTAPARHASDSLTAQLTYIREQWSSLLGRYLLRLLSGLDFIREEEKMRFAGPGPAEAYDFTGFEEEIEGFSPDKDWMPKVVLIAKSVYVWLDQLSRIYGREVDRLDQIPDEELDVLARRGFTALWLIGLWERSRASKRVKQICGNPEAEASAYSITHYDIAANLGGWPALYNLKERCLARGILLASDMVPNHTGIDSSWVTEHPDWFVQLPHPPFPSYSYTGTNLSDNPRVGLFLEDHYYDRTDAAVTFKWVDFNTGETRYIYHGNDGTSMPWNDTAQVNFLHPEAREAVIRTILHVARNFSIIRFDAAMILAKKHYQRLWFPEPGSGGDIPSRAEQGMTKAEFNRAMPKEFWREVVDRIAVEAPETLLLAEAFWMMEGYFVRSLGMHRVYNSAFMNMLKQEENAKYRTTVKNTIEFDPGILNRFVNFMNNPDEETAVAQFGKGDKYFGICTMMVTMPGLPMIGHGQIEGFAEKYGMEYSRAYWDETPDWDLVARHEREIFPLMKRRSLFAGSENFLLYGLVRYGRDGRDGQDGHVNENVFAYSNAEGGARGLVLYNNAYERAEGRLSRSAPFAVKEQGGGKRTETRTLAEGLGVRNEAGRFTVFREQTSGLHYIRDNRELHENGLFVSLNGFEYQVFLDFFEIEDNEKGHYRLLAESLGGAGFADLETALKKVVLDPLHRVFFEAFPASLLKRTYAAFDADAGGGRAGGGPVGRELELSGEEREAYKRFVRKTADFLGEEYLGISTISTVSTAAEGEADRESVADTACARFEANLKSLEALAEAFAGAITRPGGADGAGETGGDSGPLSFALDYLRRGLAIMPETVAVLSGYAFIAPLSVLAETDAAGTSVMETRSIIEELWFERPFARLWREAETRPEARPAVPPDAVERSLEALKLFSSDLGWADQVADGKQRAYYTMDRLFRNRESAVFLGVNRYRDVLYFNREAYYETVWWLYLAEAVRSMDSEGASEGDEALAFSFLTVREWIAVLDYSGYRVEKLLALLEP